MDLLTGKVAIVTGGSKGMGRHFVESLASAGAGVACLARPSAELDDVPKISPGVMALACDVSKPEDVNDAVAEVGKRLGRIDIVVNNAASYQPFVLETADDEQIRRPLDLNILGVLWMVRATIPYLRETAGQIVTISSESVRHPFPMQSVYAASKAAIETLNAALRDELQPQGIRVSVLRSGTVAGTAGISTWPEGVAESFFRKIAETGHAAIAGQPATPESMAKALLAMVTLPKDVNVDFMEVRSACSGVPDGVSRATD